MRRQGSWQALARWLVAAGLASASGCFHVHAIAPPGPEWVEPCQSIPLSGRNHVYIFFVHGLDPLDCANLKGVCEFVQRLGFNKTYYGQLYHTGHFRNEIRRIHQEDPDARFVLIGFSFGANQVRSIAQAVKPDGITIDLLVYLSGNTLKNIPRDRPENACRIINILAEGCIWNGAMLEGAENFQVNKVWHYGSPTHYYTLDTLARELAAVAATVPVVLPPEPHLEPDPEAAPTPRPLTRPPDSPRDEWDFLKPVPRLGDRMPPAEDR
ncbi:MAG TPA: hypothetical protein VNK04_01485 [Gemmataceae bacterium]|nr:hypothetical protein [Gemmataceae bacterium]